MSDVSRLLYIFGILAVAAVAFIYGFDLNGPPIRSDGFAYHAYLPALFIDHDLTFKTLANRFFGGDVPAWAELHFYPETGNYLDKYPIGTALLQSPFFLAADGVTMLLGLERSGASLPYQIANIVSGIVYFLLGVWLIHRTLSDYFDAAIVRLTVWLFVFGTGLFHYATYDGSWSHVYSFALVAAFVRLALRYGVAPTAGKAVLGGVVLGLICITRPNNGIVALIALGIWICSAHGRSPGAPLRDATLFVACAVAVGVPQLLYWREATGHLLVYAYGTERFYWTNPQILRFLFSVQKGLFLWTPALALSVIGFFTLPPRLRVFGICGAACLAIHVYVCSAWWYWFFGAFGNRSFVDMTGILALPMAAGLCFVVKHSSLAVARRLAGALMGLNLLLMFGYWSYVIPMEGLTQEVLDDYSAVVSAFLRGESE